MDSPITYIHPEKASFASKIMPHVFSLFGLKKGREVIEKANQRASSEVPAQVPKSMCKNYDVGESSVEHRKVWTIKPRGNASDKVILYLHGGAYVFSIGKYHWKFVEALLLRTNATIVVPDYPLAPDSTCEEAIDFIGRLYQELSLTYSPWNMVLTGDSAGAGLALGFAMTLRDAKKPQPGQIILLSPWLDVTMSTEEMLAIDPKDKILGIGYLKIAGKAFAGRLELNDYRISPLYGDFSGLGMISVFIGTHDLFVADCRKLKRRTERSAIAINYFEYPGMFHDWIIIGNTKEAKVALNQIGSLINDP